MKIYPDKLVADLKARMHKLYIVSGDEQLLVQETTDLIRRALRARGFYERELFLIFKKFLEVLFGLLHKNIKEEPVFRGRIIMGEEIL